MPELVLAEHAASRSLTVGNTVKTEDKQLLSYYKELANVGYFNSGLLPVDGSGILSMRNAGDRFQFVYQIAPSINYIIWGSYEGGAATTYMLAQPYKIIIGDHVNGELRGARHFYSPVPITSLGQVLYAVNVPNTNTTGYSGTSIGWICLYHTGNYSGLTLNQRIFKTLERASGQEAYNDANMSGTDGTRFYKKRFPNKKYLWDPNEWQQKSTQEGYDWTLDPDLWVPHKVLNCDSQDTYLENGTLFTLEMAMYGNYKSYYPHKAKDEAPMSLMNQIDRDDLKNPGPAKIHNFFNVAFNKADKYKEEEVIVAAPTVPGLGGGLLVINDDDEVVTTGAPMMTPDQWFVAEPIGHCTNCDSSIEDDDEYYIDNNDNYICAPCYNEHYFKTNCCELVKHATTLFTWLVGNEPLYYCFDCHTKSQCPSCSQEYLDAPEALFDDCCVECGGTPMYCDSCGERSKEANAKIVALKVPTEEGDLTDSTATFCLECFSHSVMCACGLVKPEGTTSTLPGSNTEVCEGCVSFGDDGSVSHVSIYQKVPVN